MSERSTSELRPAPRVMGIYIYISLQTNNLVVPNPEAFGGKFVSKVTSDPATR